MPIDRTRTPEDIKAHREHDLARFRDEAKNHTLEDPEGRIRKGQRIRWRHATNPDADMEVLYLVAPMGLYDRPLRDDDHSPVADMARILNKMRSNSDPDGGIRIARIPCSADHPEARYNPDGLMVFYRCLIDDGCTTGHAKHMIVVSETL